jgi:uncharacterized membrane-anchored protein
MDVKMRRELAQSASTPAVATSPQGMEVTRSYWFAMLAASAFGTNVGDLWAEILFPGRTTSLASLLAICVAAIWYHRRMAARTEAGYWIAIVAMRAAATNVADICTHDLGLGYVSVSVLLGILTLIAARFATVDFSRSGLPRVDGAYWTAMFIAGVFGTVAGDLIHHNIGLYNASAALCLLLAGLILIREVRAPVSMLLFWSIVMAERCAGTAIGDALASHRAVGLGVPVASIFTGTLTIISLLVRARLSRR